MHKISCRIQVHYQFPNAYMSIKFHRVSLIILSKTRSNWFVQSLLTIKFSQDVVLCNIVYTVQVMKLSNLKLLSLIRLVQNLDTKYLTLDLGINYLTNKNRTLLICKLTVLHLSYYQATLLTTFSHCPIPYLCLDEIAISDKTA